MDWEAIITNRNSEVSRLDDILIDAERKKWATDMVRTQYSGMDHLMALKTWEKCGITSQVDPF